MIFITNFIPTEAYLTKYTNIVNKFHGKAIIYPYPSPPDIEYYTNYDRALKMGLYSLYCTPDIKDEIWEEIISLVLLGIK